MANIAIALILPNPRCGDGALPFPRGEGQKEEDHGL